MKKVIVILLMLTLPLMFLNGCSKKQEAKQETQTEELEKAPADTTTPEDTTTSTPPAPQE